MDLNGPLVNSEGYKCILTIMDHFTKWIETRRLGSKEAKEGAKGIFSFYCREGAPVQIIFDNGSTSPFVMEVLLNIFIGFI